MHSSISIRAGNWGILPWAQYSLVNQTHFFLYIRTNILGLVHETMGPTLLMGPKGRYTIIEQSNTLLKESLHILCPAWAPHTLLAALISIALLSSLILSLSSLASLLTSLAIILPRVMCANDECFVHRISGILFTFRTQRDARTYTKLEWLF